MRDVARGRWLHLVRGRRRRRASLALGAAIAAALPLAWLVAGRRAPAPSIAPTVRLRVEAVAGGARADGDALAVGDLVASGTIVTTGPAGALALQLPGGTSLRVGQATTLRLAQAGRRAMALQRGAIYVDSGPGSGAHGTVTIATRFGLIEDVGTQFAVHLADGGLRIEVREGLVRLRRDGPSGTARRIDAGSRLTLDRDGAATIRPLSAHDETWAWLDPITPAPDIDGMTARAFLDWASRETGYPLAFADDAVARAAEGIVLEGSAAGLSPRQALDAVLPTCGLVHRFERDALLVDLGDRDEHV